jgi:hypothetical protein
MFDVTPEDIARLADDALRELIGRLCEAELARRGYSPSAATWGGHQSATDGGLDVRVTLPKGSATEGFIPRASTGFQVKKPDMPRSAILTEMRPDGEVRQVLKELAADRGAYIIVSGTGSTSDSALRQRRLAMREALSEVKQADALHTDFFDRTRIATWVRQHAGLVAWVREIAGRSAVGWRPYGPWSGAAREGCVEYLFDEKLRLHLERNRAVPSQRVADGIDSIRDTLAQPAGIVRLVGLSGVGKTRLAEALFETNIGRRPLHPSLAVYTNLSDNPSPQPMGLASDLIANRARAILIVDNCPSDLHGRLAEVVRAPDSTVSLLTVEYDVRDDQPEGTQVVRLETSSPELIQKLVQRRYPRLSQVDARSIAEAAGGNARMAFALAETVRDSEAISGLSSDELFQRLFRQRHVENDALLRAARACSLVYSFDGETLGGDQAELPLLASLVNQTPTELFGHVGELARRELIQRRGQWRAVLPHAMANRLAVQALEDIPIALIEQVVVRGKNSRLARSFSRRLSFLHESPAAISIVSNWLESGGYLHDVTSLDEVERSIFENVASVLPGNALAALQRAMNQPEREPTVYRGYLQLIRSLAYDAALFDRSMQILALVATESTDEKEAKEASDIFLSLFPICLSGTHASVGQRIRIAEVLVRRRDCRRALDLGIEAIDRLMEATHFSSGYQFDFGARSRDYGYEPSTDAEVEGWYGSVLGLVEHLYAQEPTLKADLKVVLARNFRGLWTSARSYAAVDKIARRMLADGFWRDGWIACRQVIQFDAESMVGEMRAALLSLEQSLRPVSVEERVQAVVLGRARASTLDDVDDETDISAALARQEAAACELGRLVAHDSAVMQALLPELARGGARTWSFGRGLSEAALDRAAVWHRLVAAFRQLPQDERDVQVLRGFLMDVWERDRELGHRLLDELAEDPMMAMHGPVLHSAIRMDDRCVERLRLALVSDQFPVAAYRGLAYGRATDALSGQSLSALVWDIATRQDGFDVAVDILDSHLHVVRAEKREADALVVGAGRKLLRHSQFQNRNDISVYHLAELARACLGGPDASTDAAAVALRLKQAVKARETTPLSITDLLEVLFELHALPVLDVLFPGAEAEDRDGLNMFHNLGDGRKNPVDAISTELLLAWCAGNPQNRFPLAACIVTFAIHSDSDGLTRWSEHATAVLRNALAPDVVLGIFIQRFQPRSWSGSRASIVESNSKLLDCLEPPLERKLSAFVAEAKVKLEQVVESERAWETSLDRKRDERFE